MWKFLILILSAMGLSLFENRYQQRLSYFSERRCFMGTCILLSVFICPDLPYSFQYDVSGFLRLFRSQIFYAIQRIRHFQILALMHQIRIR